MSAAYATAAAKKPASQIDPKTILTSPPRLLRTPLSLAVTNTRKPPTHTRTAVSRVVNPGIDSIGLRGRGPSVRVAAHV